MPLVLPAHQDSLTPLKPSHDTSAQAPTSCSLSDAPPGLGACANNPGGKSSGAGWNVGTVLGGNGVPSSACAVPPRVAARAQIIMMRDMIFPTYCFSKTRTWLNDCPFGVAPTAVTVIVLLSGL